MMAGYSVSQFYVGLGEKYLGMRSKNRPLPSFHSTKIRVCSCSRARPIALSGLRREKLCESYLPPREAWWPYRWGSCKQLAGLIRRICKGSLWFKCYEAKAHRTMPLLSNELLWINVVLKLFPSSCPLRQSVAGSLRPLLEASIWHWMFYDDLWEIYGLLYAHINGPWLLIFSFFKFLSAGRLPYLLPETLQ